LAEALGGASDQYDFSLQAHVGFLWLCLANSDVVFLVAAQQVCER